MSDDRLRRELMSLGYTPGPITDSTRSILRKKLEKLRIEASKPRNLFKPNESLRRGGEGLRHRPQKHWSDRHVDDDNEEEEDDNEEEEDEEEEKREIKDPRTTHASNYLLSSISRPAAETFSRRRETLQEEDRWKTDRRVDEVLYPRSVTPAPRQLWRERGEGFAPGFADYYRHNGRDWQLGSSVGSSSSPYSRTGSNDQYTNQYTNQYKYMKQDTCGDVKSLSHKGLASLNGEKAGHWKPNWAISFDYYLTKLLRAMCILLGIVFIGIIAFKTGISITQQNSSLKLIAPDCEGRRDSYCKAKEKQIHIEILSELYDYLSIEAGKFDCGNPSSGLSSKCVPIDRAKKHVMNVRDCSAETFDSALDWLLNSDRHLGIWAKGEDGEEAVTTRSDVVCVESSRPRLGVICRMKNALYTAVSNLFLALLAILFLWLLLVLLRYHWQRLEEEEKQMFDMVKKIIDVVELHYKDWVDRKVQNPYIGILHVRDTLTMPQERKRLKGVWDRAVHFIENNESRLRTENQRVAGADINVWRWTIAQKESSREQTSSAPFYFGHRGFSSGIGQ